MRRREFIKSGLFGLGAFACGTAGLFAAEAEKHGLNVLWIGVDDLRCGLGCYGADHIHSPNIDGLAAKGVLFKRAYVQQAVCAASRASFLTGCRPETTTVDYPYNDYFSGDFLSMHPSLPNYFCRHGHYARAGGKIHHGGIFDLRTQDLSGPYLSDGGGDPWWQGYALPENRAKQEKTRKAPPYECADVPDDAYRDGRLTKVAIQYLRDAAAQQKPFFITPGFHKPHLPFCAPKKYWDLYDRDEIELAPNPDRPEGVEPDYTIATYELPHYEGGYGTDRNPVSPELAITLRHAYYACTSYIDAQVGKLLKALDEFGFAENTVVMLWSDHGWQLGDTGMWGKHVNYEWATHSPLIVYAPGMAGNRRASDALVEYVDMFPTLCELTGIPGPDYLEGTSLVPLLERPERPWKDAVFHQYPRGNKEGFAIRTDRYRYVEWRLIKGRDKGQVTLRELYDYQTDPHEEVNVAEARPDLCRRLAARLHAGWREALPGNRTNA